MAEKDLVYFKQWIPAGHQMDKYSANPWCLFSKNVDIFSSSNSYKATAFSAPDSQADWVIAVDDRNRIILKSNWDVVDTANNNQVIINPVTNFDQEKLYVNYVWYSRYTTDYTQATFWTLKWLIVKYEWDTYKEIIVYSDRMMYTYSTTEFDKPEYNYVWGTNKASIDPNHNNWAVLVTWLTSTSFTLYLNTNVKWFQWLRIPINYYTQWWTTETVKITAAYNDCPYMYYEASTDRMEQAPSMYNDTRTVATNLDVPYNSFAYVNCLLYNRWDNRSIDFRVTITSSSTINSSNPRTWKIYFERPELVSWQTYWEYYTYLPLDTNRVYKNIWEYYFNPWKTYPSLWNFSSNWVKRLNQFNSDDSTTLYDFVQYMWWEIDPAQVAVDAVVLKERVFLICNQDWNWYIFPCDLSWWKGTPYIAYWVEFKAAIVMNYLIYLVGENRWISTLFVYNEQELVHVVEWNEKNWERDDYISKSEQFKFNWMMADWRWRLILGTEDNRVFCYWQTYWWRWWAFIHTLEDWQTLESIRTIGKDLLITYVEGWVTKTIKYQDDTAIKHYNTEFEVVYPVILWNHIIEKEIYDLYCSYRLPSSSTKLEFWIAVNHNYFWSFRLPSRPNLEIWQIMYLSSVVESMDYSLKLVEINDDWYTFILDWNMPVQDSFLAEYKTIYKPIEVWHPVEEYAFTEYNNFKKIREITTDKFKEWYYREENITNKLSLPRTHSIQLMVRWKWTVNHTPEVFWLTLESNQRNRW